MDQNVLNELLNKIKSLEDRNDNIRKEIKQKREELNSQSTIITQPFLKDDKMEIDDIETGFNLPQEYLDIQLNEVNITSNVKEYTIEYIPYDQIGTLYIMGDFTNWEMKPMNKSKGIFSYTCILLANFRYFYCMSSDGQIIVDMNHLYEKNPRNDQIANYVDIVNKPSQKTDCFNYQLHGNILELQKKNFLMIKTGNWNEVVFLDKLKRDSNDYNTNYHKLTSDNYQITNSLSTYYDTLINQGLPIAREKLKQILSNYNERIIVKDNKEYQIFEITDCGSAFRCFLLYDCNHIKQNREFYINNHLYYTYAPNEIFKETTKFYSKEESIKYMERYNSNTDDVIKVYYKSSNLPFNNNNNTNFNSYHRYALGSIRASKIEPERLNKDDYIYEVLNDKIVQVKNRQDSTYVQFTAIEKANTKENDMTMYYSMNVDFLNIIHLHYKNLFLQSKIIEAVFIEPNVDYHVYKEKSNEEPNQNKLLVLCRGKKPFRLYCNGNKYYFESIALQTDHLYKVKSNSMDSSFNQFYVKIKQLPIRLLFKTNAITINTTTTTTTTATAMTSSSENKDVKYSTHQYEIIEQCVHDNNTGGYVDCAVLFDEDKCILSDELLFAFPPCVLAVLQPKEESDFEKRYEEHNRKHSSDEMMKFDSIKKEVNALSKYASDKSEIEKLTKEQVKKIIASLKEYETSTLDIMSYIEKNELWDYLEEITRVMGLFRTYIDLFSIYQ